MSQPPADPFDTGGLRAAVLEAWRSSPTRYREDANVEEDYGLGAYRDRLIVELAQNGADAARAAGVVCRMLVKLGDDGMVVANTGAPLDAAGVQSMAAMRASAKGPDGVGRFGVGFAAVLSVTDAPAIGSRNGGIRFSRNDSAELMRRDPVLGELLMERQPPVMRLPFAYDRTNVGEYDTAVILPWRSPSSRERAVDALRTIDDALFVALPDLAEVVIEGAPSDVPQRWEAKRTGSVLTVSVDGRERRWYLSTSNGEWSAAARTEAPTESRGRATWTLTWALPAMTDGSIAAWPPAEEIGTPQRVIHAPTPTDEPLGLPALLVGDFPVDASRRRLAEGAMTDVLLEAASISYVQLVQEVAVSQGAAATTLVPSADLVGPIDHRLRNDVRERLSRTPWVPLANGEVRTPAEAVTVEPTDTELLRAVAPYLDDLLAPDWLSHATVLRGLGLSVRSWHDIWDALAPLELSGETWYEIYAAASGLERSALEGLPVPLADGRVVRDARHCVIASSGATSVSDALRALGLSVVDRAALHPLLERLGAKPFDAREHLGHEFIARVRGDVDLDPGHARELLSAAAAALAWSGILPGELVSLASVPVPTQSGDWASASRVVLPNSSLARYADPTMLLDAALASDHRDGWVALGVLEAPTVVEVGETPLDPQAWDELMVDGGEWCDEAADELNSRSPDELLATSVKVVHGLELVEAMPLKEALNVLASPDIRRAIVDPTMVLDANGMGRTVTSPAAWWLSEAPLFAGRTPTSIRLPGDGRLAPFFPEVEVPGTPDLALLEALGVHTTLDAWVQRPGGVSELLELMASAGTTVPGDVVAGLYRALVSADADPDDVDVPDAVLALADGDWQKVATDKVLVAHAPHHAAVLTHPFIPGDERLGDLLDARLSDDAACDAASLRGRGELRDLPAELSSERLSTYREHDDLTVNGVAVDWWVTDDGEVHMCTVDGLARGLAWASRRWERRWELAAKLAGASTSARDKLEALYDN